MWKALCISIAGASPPKKVWAKGTNSISPEGEVSRMTGREFALKKEEFFLCEGNSLEGK